MLIATGTKLGRYEIRSKIGEGGMGEVYLGEDTKLELKILPAEVAADRNRMSRFVSESFSALRSLDAEIPSSQEYSAKHSAG